MPWPRRGAPSVEVAEHAAVLAALSASSPAASWSSTSGLRRPPRPSWTHRRAGRSASSLSSSPPTTSSTTRRRSPGERPKPQPDAGSPTPRRAASPPAARPRPCCYPRAQRLDVQLPGLSAVRISRAQLDRPVARVANSAAECLLDSARSPGCGAPPVRAGRGLRPVLAHHQCLVSEVRGGSLVGPGGGRGGAQAPGGVRAGGRASGDEPHDAWAFAVPPPANRPPLAAPAREPPIAPRHGVPARPPTPHRHRGRSGGRRPGSGSSERVAASGSASTHRGAGDAGAAQRTRSAPLQRALAPGDPRPLCRVRSATSQHPPNRFRTRTPRPRAARG